MVVPLLPVVVQLTVSGGVRPVAVMVKRPSLWQGGVTSENERVCERETMARAIKRTTRVNFLIITALDLCY